MQRNYIVAEAISSPRPWNCDPNCCPAGKKCEPEKLVPGRSNCRLGSRMSLGRRFFEQFHERMEGLIDGRGNAQFPSAASDEAVERIDFRALAAFDVLGGRG